MIVITLTKTPPALRGDLTRWCQEIQTGVYVGDVSARVRDKLWERVQTNIGNGEATLVYNTNNEQGYAFKTTRKSKQVVDLDGMLFVKHVVNQETVEHGFSNAAKFHKAHKAEKMRASAAAKPKGVVAVDIETTGLNTETDQILSIGAVKHDGTEFYRLIKQDIDVPKQIVELTGITSEMLSKEGVPLQDALEELTDFVGNVPIVGYNFRFDSAFLNRDYRKCGMQELKNEIKDLLPVVKRKEKFLDNYKLRTVLSNYGIENKVPHNAVSDARATKELAMKLIKNRILVI
ncbi:type I-E CRISPR-associated endoribonuclease Cas2e [Lactobacillus delbrueckii subsp. bulgaricus]|nr:type I-E CRISPR-associated endoribonuclease Cas2 [Lactobacillus delbrueckii subsp. bulgaricus]MBT9095271.1 type I-E CRISPR-associated endoribonuclease Cas2 [Lactobacillus delbrueckii subsp. bulgaricus]